MQALLVHNPTAGTKGHDKGSGGISKFYFYRRWDRAKCGRFDGDAVFCCIIVAAAITLSLGSKTFPSPAACFLQ